jgi:hypothetical protein
MLTYVTEVRTSSIIRAMMEVAFIAVMMEAVHTSETSDNNYLKTWQYIPEDSKLTFVCRYDMSVSR